jgi:hypothetical protein
MASPYHSTNRNERREQERQITQQEWDQLKTWLRKTCKEQNMSMIEVFYHLHLPATDRLLKLVYLDEPWIPQLSYLGGSRDEVRLINYTILAMKKPHFKTIDLIGQCYIYFGYKDIYYKNYGEFHKRGVIGMDVDISSTEVTWHIHNKLAPDWHFFLAKLGLPMKMVQRTNYKFDYSDLSITVSPH